MTRRKYIENNPTHTELNGDHLLGFHTDEQSNCSNSFYVTVTKEGLDIMIYAAKWKGKKRGHKKLKEEEGFKITNYISLTWNELKEFIPKVDKLNPRLQNSQL